MESSQIAEMSHSEPNRYQLAAQKPRVSQRLIEAVKIIVYSGASIVEAAKATGYTKTALSTALKKPHVMALKRDIVASFWANSADVARKALLDCCIQDKDWSVKVRAAALILEKEGELGRSEAVDAAIKVASATINLIQYQPGQAVRQIGDLTPKEPQVIEGTAISVQPFNTNGENA